MKLYVYIDKPCFPIDTTYFVKINKNIEINFKYLYFILKELNLTELKGGGAVPGLNRNDVYATRKIPLPPLSVQQEIVAEIEGYQKIIDGARQVVWQRIEQLINNDRLLAPKEVLFEIGNIDDKLHSWSKTQNKLFVEPTPKQIDIVRDILKKYPALINIDRKYDADPWVIALSIELINSQQMTLFTIKRIVVTEEKLRGNRIRIPFVCQDYKIEFLDIIGMFREEGWKF